jgi:DnaJ-domain-containing protein 1
VQFGVSFIVQWSAHLGFFCFVLRRALLSALYHSTISSSGRQAEEAVLPEYKNLLLWCTGGRAA